MDELDSVIKFYTQIGFDTKRFACLQQMQRQIENQLQLQANSNQINTMFSLVESKDKLISRKIRNLIDMGCMQETCKDLFNA